MRKACCTHFYFVFRPVCTIFAKNEDRKEETMARPIKETPILFGEDARRFEERMKQVRKETPEEREQRLADYALFLKMLERGKQARKQDV